MTWVISEADGKSNVGIRGEAYSQSIKKVVRGGDGDGERMHGQSYWS